MPTTLAELRDRVLVCHGGGHDYSVLPRLRLRVAHRPKSPLPVAFAPMLYFVLQGTKQLTMGRNVIDYGASSMVVMAIDLPALSRVTAATADAPYVAIELVVDPVTLAEVMLAHPGPAGHNRAFKIDQLPASIVDPLYRLVGLLETPQHAGMLAPMIEREILYYALLEPSGTLLRHLVAPYSNVARIGTVISRMRANAAEPLQIEVLARHAGMSATTFHRQFKAITSLSPIAFYKQLRLQEARRQVLTRPGQIAQVAITVGYRSLSQFTRDYRALFGVSPAHDAAVERGARIACRCTITTPS